MTIAELTNLIAASCALTFAAGMAIHRPRHLAQWLFLAGMILLGLEAFFHLASLSSAVGERMGFWQRTSMIPASALPGVWLAFSLCYARYEPMRFLKRWFPVLAVLGVVPVALSLWSWAQMAANPVWVPQAPHWVFPIGPAAKVVYLSILVGAVAMLANLEWTFRAAVGTARWKIKYAVIGLALWCGARIFTSSQAFLFSAVGAQLLVVKSAALIVACLFLAVSVYRSKLSQLDIYPSSEALHKSFSVILAGVYLALVGLMAKGVSAAAGPLAFPLIAVLVLLALGGLGVLCFSDRVRRAGREFISRHFRRPIHDYRNIWSGYAHRTAGVLDRQEFARTAAKLLSETFDALSVTVWLADIRERVLLFSASTSIEAGSPETAPLAGEVYEGVCALGEPGRPVDIDRADPAWCERLRQSNPSRFLTGGHRYCLPMMFGGELVGLIVMGDRVGGARFSLEDLELFKCLGDQIAASLRNLQLSEQLIHARELEAFQTMSTFLVHDLKNTASALSLTLRNLPTHFDNPEFREDALRTLTKSVGRVNELIGRLTLLRQRLELHRTRADLNDIVESALASAGELAGVTIERQFGQLPPVLVDVPQIESAVVNLVINAREAVLPQGNIRVETGLQDGGVLLAVADNGCGMSPEFMANSLFRPFKTSKKNGLGIGMFQTKTIIEAHGGRITARSKLGAGSTFLVWLPLSVPTTAKEK